MRRTTPTMVMRGVPGPLPRLAGLDHLLGVRTLLIRHLDGQGEVVGVERTIGDRDGRTMVMGGRAVELRQRHVMFVFGGHDLEPR
jgi:hypothetical protein